MKYDIQASFFSFFYCTDYNQPIPIWYHKCSITTKRETWQHVQQQWWIQSPYPGPNKPAPPPPPSLVPYFFHNEETQRRKENQPEKTVWCRRFSSVTLLFQKGGGTFPKTPPRRIIHRRLHQRKTPRCQCTIKMYCIIKNENLLQACFRHRCL